MRWFKEETIWEQKKNNDSFARGKKKRVAHRATM